MTKEDWKKVEEAWGGFGSIELKIDGYKVVLKLVVDRKKMIMFMELFVNGQLEGKNLFPDKETNEFTDIGRRFYQTHKHPVFSSAKKAKMKKVMGARLYNKMNKDRGYDKTIDYKTPTWRSFTAFKKHIIKHNKDIQLIEA